MNPVVVWLLLAAVFLVVELVTVGMVSIWFLVGALAGALCAALKAALWIQVLVFILVSVLSFLLLYPRLKHLIIRRRQATNADMVIGQTCVVTRRIDNVAGTGAVSVGGKVWSARTRDGGTAEKGALVQAVEIQGVKLIVAPIKE